MPSDAEYNHLREMYQIAKDRSEKAESERDRAFGAMREAQSKIHHLTRSWAWADVNAACRILEAALPPQPTDKPKLPKISETPGIEITGGMDSVDYVRGIRDGTLNLDPPTVAQEVECPNPYCHKGRVAVNVQELNPSWIECDQCHGSGKVAREERDDAMELCSKCAAVLLRKGDLCHVRGCPNSEGVA